MSWVYFLRMSQKILNANSMEGSKEFFLRVREHEYYDLPLYLRQRSIVYFNDYELYKDNPHFKALNKAYRDAKKALENWKFDQRNK